METKGTQSSWPPGRRGHQGGGAPVPILQLRMHQSPSSDLLAYSPTPSPQLPDFCIDGFAHLSKYSGCIKPELTCVYSRANEQCGPCFSSAITQLLLCLAVTVGKSGWRLVGLGIYFAVHPLCCFVVQLLGFLKNKGLQAVNHCDIFHLLV